MDYLQDPRTVGMLGGFGPLSEPLPITRELLIQVAAAWPVSPHTPEPVAEQLRVSRELFVHCLLVWEFGAVGMAWSLLAVGPACGGRSTPPSARCRSALIKRARAG